jgi:cytochrome c556
MTAEEEAYQKVMRQVGPANTALRGAIDKMDSAAVKDQAAILTKAFTQTEAFWKTRGKADAVGFAVEARKHADAITTAANAGKWDDIKAAATPLGQQCASCHGAYRERLDDGSFRIKAGSR